MFFDKAAGNLFSELNEVFDPKTARQLYVTALLRASDPDIRDRKLKFAYQTSYISEIYPGVPLSEINKRTNYFFNIYST